MASELAMPQPVPPPNQEKWASLTSLNMMNARNLIREMKAKVRQNEIEEAASKNAAQEQANREKEAKKVKVYSSAKEHEQVISTSFKCMQDIEDAILQMESSVTKLTHERYAGFAALQVCERRLELRSKRPPSEFFRDNLSDALEAEQKLLVKARKEIQDMQEEGKKIVEELSGMRDDLSHDTGERRLVMMHDLSSLRPQLTLPPLGRSSEAPVGGDATLPPEPSSPADSLSAAVAADTANAAQADAASNKQSAELLKATNQLLERANQFCLRTMAVLERVQQESKLAKCRTEDCLSRRCASLTELKRKLEQHALDVEATITTAERSLVRSERRVDPKDKARMEKLAHDKAALEKLRLSRVVLQQEIRNKFVALEIDNTCRRVTPAKASEARPQSRGVPRSSSAPSLRKDQNQSGMELSFVDPGTPSSRTPTSAKPSSPGGSRSLAAAAAQALQC